jgi:hypothetical protein
VLHDRLTETDDFHKRQARKIKSFLHNIVHSEALSRQALCDKIDADTSGRLLIPL